MARNENEMTASIPETTKLKLFKYPGKRGAFNSYPTTWCVGFERYNNGFVSQTFVTKWTENYADALAKFHTWEQVLAAARDEKYVKATRTLAAGREGIANATPSKE